MMARKPKRVVPVPTWMVPQKKRSRLTKVLISRASQEQRSEGHHFRQIKVSGMTLVGAIASGAIYARFRNREPVVDAIVHKGNINGLAAWAHVTDAADTGWSASAPLREK
jgi:hypothetical protein